MQTIRMSIYMSKADSTELIEGYDLSDKFKYLPDDSIKGDQQVKL